MKLSIIAFFFMLGVSIFELVLSILSFFQNNLNGFIFLFLSLLLFFVSYKSYKEIKDESRRKNQC